jgi:ComF family protein
MYKLPVTNFYKEHNNPVEQIFWGRVMVEHATAGYFFRKGNSVQKLIHLIKYKGQKEMGALLGHEMGKSLRNSYFSEIDLIVPVPIHQEKLHKRGYNQSEWIAQGVATMLQKPIDVKTLIRSNNAGTQTRKNRLERYDNVVSCFELTNLDTFSGRHILLIDDVITTGATLEACIQAVLSAPKTKVSVAALAKASD